MYYLASVSTQLAPPAKRRLVLISGQSNAVGKAELADGTGLTTSLGSPFHNVGLRQHITSDPTTPYTFTDFPRAPLAPRPYYLDDDVRTGNFGIELSMGHRLYEQNPNGNFDIIKMAIDNTNLALWTPDLLTSSVSKGPNLFLQLLHFVRESERAMDGTLAGMVWIQGEADAVGSNFAANYETRLSRLLQEMRRIWPVMPFVIVQLHDSNSGTYKDDIRTAQQNVANADPDLTVLVDADDLTLKADLLHYTADSLNTLGERCADALLSMDLSPIPDDPDDWTTDDTSTKAKPNGTYEWNNFMLGAAELTLVPPNAPTHHFRCQDLSTANGGDGNLHDSINGFNLTALTAATALESTIAGWTHKGLTFGGGSGTGVGVRGDPGAGWDTSAESVFMIIRAKCPAPAAERCIMVLTDGGTGGAQIISVNQLSTGKLKVYSNGTNTTSVSSHATGSDILIGLRYNRTASTLTLLTSVEKLTVPWHSSADGYKGVYDYTFQQLNSAMELHDIIAFTGSNAEITDAQVKALYEAMGETISWS